MKFRMHRGSLEESMCTVVEVHSVDELISHVFEQMPELAPRFGNSLLRIKPYGGDDTRIGWQDVHIVTIDGYGVVGFCEGHPAPPPLHQ